MGEQTHSHRISRMQQLRSVGCRLMANDFSRRAAHACVSPLSVSMNCHSDVLPIRLRRPFFSLGESSAASRLLSSGPKVPKGFENFYPKGKKSDAGRAEKEDDNDSKFQSGGDGDEK